MEYKMDFSDHQVWKNHSALFKRLRKSFYYGHTKNPIIEGSSLPLTEVTVDLIEKTITNERRCLGELDVNYASHILHQAALSPASIMIALIYLERLKGLNSDYLRQITPCELFLVSLVVASKFLFDKGEDEIIYNDEWALFANFDLEDLNRIECEFLDAMNWSCYVDSKTFLDQLTKLEGLISIKEYLKRQNAYMTYTELLCLFNYIKSCHKDQAIFWANFKNFTQTVIIVSVAYCAAVFVLVISFSVGVYLHHSIILNRSLEDNANSTIQIENVYINYPTNNLLIDPKLFRANITTQNLNKIGYGIHLLIKPRYNNIVKCCK